VDVVSKNGNLLLNVGPKADGTLPEGDKKILRDLADWMAVNREAIHGAKVWRKSSEGPTKMQEGQFSDQKEIVYTPQDYRFTVNHGNIYVIALKCPQDGNFCVRSLAESSDQNLPEFHGIIRQVEVLGYEKSPEWKTDAEGLHVKTSGFYSEFPVVLKIVVS
jgi:alpha-L-fucosidase